MSQGVLTNLGTPNYFPVARCRSSICARSHWETKNQMNRLEKALSRARKFWERRRGRSSGLAANGPADVGVWRPRICHNQDPFHGPVLSSHEPEEKGNPMASAPITKHGFSSPGCDGRRLTKHCSRFAARPRRVVSTIGRLATLRAILPENPHREADPQKNIFYHAVEQIRKHFCELLQHELARLSNDRVVACRLTLLVVMASTFPVSAQDQDRNTTSSNDLVLFFKDSIRISPNIEYFSARQRILRQPDTPSSGGLFSRAADASTLPPPQMFEGKCSKGNFLLFYIKTNSQTGNLYTNIVGRSEVQSYQINANTLVRSADGQGSSATNMAVLLSDASLGMLRQFFNMGIGDMHAESVVWEGSEFKAARGSGVRFHGLLTSSNGIPFELSLSEVQGGKPYKKCVYEYPNPPGSLGGYPARTVVWTMLSDGLSPFLELNILKVQMAGAQIHDEAFNAALFVTTNTLYTAIYSNGSRYQLGTNGQMIMTTNEALGTQKHGIMIRKLLLVCFGVVTIAAFILTLKFSKSNLQNKTS